MMTTQNLQNRNNRQIAIWLIVIAALIFTMVVLGGVTRLTRSGLSMVEWQPIMGVIPPLNQTEWMETFEKYKQFPEYQKVNKGMSLDEFKSIFYFEYSHRVLGRTIGLAFLIPLILFWRQKKVSLAMRPKLVTIFILGGLQGLLGWFMVKSGLVDRPHVSQYRLTAHLSAAIIIYGYILWVVFDLLFPRGQTTSATSDALGRLYKWGIWSTVIVCLMIITGGFVAGTKAGFTFNTFPLMAEQFVPPGMFALSPWWHNFLENIATIQFTHRTLAYAVIAVLAIYWWMGRRLALPPRIALGFQLMLGMMVLQVLLGISTLLLVVPVSLGAAHQAGALVLFSLMLYLNHGLHRQRRPLV